MRRRLGEFREFTPLSLLPLLALTALGCTELLPDRDASVVDDAGPPTPADLHFLATSSRHTCAATTEVVYCWGYAEQGQLGTGLSPDPMDATITTPTETLALPTPIQGLFAGSDGTCAIVDSNRQLYCWGRGTSERFGSPRSVVASPTPMMGGITGVTDVAIGNGHTCFVTEDGRLYCVGSNVAGALGIGSSSGSFDTPQNVDLPGDALRVAVSTDQPPTTCAVADSGGTTDVYCWGSNADLQLAADFGILEVSEPLLVDGLSGAVDVLLEANFGCAVMSTGTVRCWGEADGGQLGSDRADSPVPMDVAAGAGLGALELGREFAVGVATGTGDIHGWGATGDGRLGVMEQVAPLAPRRLDGVADATSIVVSAHTQNSCYLARFADRAPSLRCTGNNNRGQLGTRDTVSRFSYTEIRVP